MSHPVSDTALDTLFREARSYNDWQDRDVAEPIVRAVYDLAKYGPTSANGSPARFLFIRSVEGKAKLEPHLDTTNREKTRAAPWTAVICHDVDFHEQMPKLFPHNPGAKAWFADADARELTAFRNGTLQSAYFLMAARALGLDCGPISGFDNAGVDSAFFGPDSEHPTWRSNWICNLGYGSDKDLFPRSPRLAFAEACAIL